MIEVQLIILIGFILDLLLGDPVYRGHPVRLIGHFINSLEKRLRKIRLDGKGGGLILALLTEFIFLSAYLILSHVLNIIHPVLNSIFALYIFYSFITTLFT